jgi:F-type H+-transporting ATPase subunit gamma
MRRRIRAVKSTQQITKAMKMVAASKLRRAQERVIATRPFAREARRVLASIASRVDQSAHPLLDRRRGAATGSTLLIVITADRGLCGSFNTNVVKAASQFITELPPSAGRDIALALIGRKGRDFFLRRGFDVRYEEVGLFQNVKWSHALAIATTAIREFTAGDAQSVYLVYNEFRSVISQRVVVERLLPIPKLPTQEGADAAGTVDYLFEPTPEELLNALLPFHVGIQVARALLESSAAEHAARMTAMDAATRNAREMVDRLTLYMNKVRQAAITREIIEVVSGAQSV